MIWTRNDKEGEGIATKIRWFIVVQENQDFCTRIPIRTYDGRGVLKPGVKRANHAIAYDKKLEPEPIEAERPDRWNPSYMLPSIRIQPKKKGDKLDRMSRIDFGRTYKLEHNLRVYDFGMVDRNHIERLAHQWEKVSGGKDGNDAAALYLTTSRTTDVNS